MAKRGRKTTEKDLGLARINALRQEFKKQPMIGVGIPSNAGPHLDRDGTPSGVSILEVAIFNEFGTSTAPARPAFRFSALKMRPAIIQKQKEMLEALIDGRTTMAAGLGKIGVYAKNETRRIVREWDSPPNSDATVASKGFNDPLIDTEQMVNAIDWVERKKR